MIEGIKAVTLDLDDTLWPIAPAIERAERALHRWFAEHAPAVARRYDIVALRALRDAVAAQQPQWAHDFTRVRHHSLALALASCGEDSTKADAAFEAFFAARHDLELYEEAQEALATLARRFPLLALTNGNADVARMEIGRFFVGTVSARSCGTGKPHRRIFDEACDRLGLRAAQVLHVGDDWALDVEGARAAGLHAAWLCRDAATPAPDPAVWTVRHLGEVAHRLVTN